MKFIIRENKIIGIMDSILKLSYNPDTREFYSGGTIDRVIGYKHKGGFTYAGYYADDMVSNLFGKNADEWLLIYLNQKFPHLKINKIND